MSFFVRTQHDTTYVKPKVQNSPPHPKTSIVSGDQNNVYTECTYEGVRYTITIEEKIPIAVTVAIKEAGHKKLKNPVNQRTLSRNEEL